MKLVLSYSTYTAAFGYSEKIKCLEYESKKKLLKDLKKFVEEARATYTEKRDRYSEWMQSQPKYPSSEWDEWSDKEPDHGLMIIFAGQEFCLGDFGTVDEEIKMPEVRELNEWFEEMME